MAGAVSHMLGRMPTGGGGGGSAYYTDEDLPEQTTTGTGDLSFASLTETLAAGDYLIIYSLEAKANTTAVKVSGHVKIGGSSAFTTVPGVLPLGSSDYHNLGGVFKYTHAGGSVTATVVASKDGGTGTLYAKNSRITIIPLDALDETATSIARQTTTSTTQQTAATLTFTPASTGDYYALCWFVADIAATTNVAIGVELTDGTNTTGELTLRPDNSNDRSPVLLMLPLSSVSGSTSISLKYRQNDSGSTTVAVSEVNIIALRRDRFQTAYSKQNFNTYDTSTNTYASRLSLAPTFAAGFHLNLCGYRLGSSSGSTQSQGRFVVDGTALNEFSRSTGVVLIDRAVPGGAISHNVVDFTAGSKTLSIDTKANAATGRLHKRGFILSLQLTGGGTGTQESTATSYTNEGGTGARSGMITLTATNIATGGGSLGGLIDGSLGNNYYWNFGTGDGSGWLKFDFGAGVKKIIDEFIWYHDTSSAQGTWRFEGSNDDSTYTQCGSDFTLNSGTFSVSNSTAYRYYRLRHMSGGRNNVPYLREIEFKIA